MPNTLSQTDMFAVLDGRTPLEKVNLPEEVTQQLEREDTTLLLSISGGVDSDSMCRLLMQLREHHNWPCRVVAIHADLGAMEWHESNEHCQALCAELGIEYLTVEHAKYELLEGIVARMNKRPDSPPFPSAAARYCTSGWKRDPISRWIRNNIPDGYGCICAMGLRAEESPARARKPQWIHRPGAHSTRKNRTVIDWNPILELDAQDVWGTIGYTLEELAKWQSEIAQWRINGLRGRDLTQAIVAAGFKAHPAYAMGNKRLSCALCVLACFGDLANGAEARPDTYARLKAIEQQSGFTFQQNKPLDESVAAGERGRHVG